MGWRRPGKKKKWKFNKPKGTKKAKTGGGGGREKRFQWVSS